MKAYPQTLMSLLYGLFLLSGCSEGQPAQKISTGNPTPIPVVTANELQDIVQNSKTPVLVEFSVMTGCFRCNDMRPQIQKLRENLAGRAEVVRIDFHSNQSLATSLDATVCPSYVFFSSGRPLWTQNYPSSGGLLGSKVLQELTTTSQTQSDHRSLENPTSF
ncbi:Thioredoxin [Gimesia chilikensis]|uniref:Thioredoxin n=1 Tax=Gimesia chilikensis TaxID=2605989 RepID=A0A517WGP1_9PLAN|nr:thioredoxin domain-containing protein [Gimesia chilikensis]QDU04413.1 Thioredoxin [Gimesia chilikensis]